MNNVNNVPRYLASEKIVLIAMSMDTGAMLIYLK